MERDRFYLTYGERKSERKRKRGRKLSGRENPLEILGAESGGAKAEGPRREAGEGEGEEEAFARKWWRELESRVKALRAL